MRGAAVATLVLLRSVFGCSAPATSPTGPTEIQVPSIATASAAPGPSATAQPSAAVPEGPERLDVPAEIACALPTRPRDRAKLRSRPGGPPFAAVFGNATATLHVPVGQGAEGSILEVTTDGMVVRGVFDSTEFRLQPAAVFEIGGLLVPDRGHPLRLIAGHRGEVSVGPGPVAGVTFVGPPPEARRPCSEVAVERARSFQQGGNMPVDPSHSLGHVRLPAGRAIDLSLVPGGPVVARLQGTSADPAADVVETSGAHSRVAWRRPDALVFGWVRSRDLGALKPGPTDSRSHQLMPPLVRRDFLAMETSVTCAEDVPIVVELPSERRTVGVIRAGTKFHLTGDAKQPTGAWFPVVLRALPMSSEEGAAFIVNSAAIARCTFKTPE